MMLYGLYSLVGLLGIVLLVTSYRFFRLSRSQATQISALQQQLSALCSGQPQQQSYEHAIRLARKGVDINQLIDNCNLSEEEALLITRLHGMQRQSVTDLH